MLTRAQLSRGTGLTVQTAVRLIEDLQARGMVQMGEAVARSGRGKPAMAVSLNPGYGHTLGISIATDARTLALADLSGSVLAVSEVALTDDTLCGVLTRLQAADATLLACVDAAGTRLGIGVAMSGFFTGDDAFINPPERCAPLAGSHCAPGWPRRLDNRCGWITTAASPLLAKRC